MRVALTGGTGFIGRYLLEALVTRGDEVQALVRSPTAAAALAGRCRVVEGGLEDASARRELVAGAAIVYHLAGRIGAPSLAEFRRVNRDAAALLAEDARAAQVSRFLLVSSLAATGPSPRGVSLDESSGPGPVTDYGLSKLEGEAAVRASGVPLTIVRPPAVYGPGDRAFRPLYQLVARHGVFPLLGDGRQELSLVFAADLARALVAAARSPATLGGTYHAAHAEVVTQPGLAAAIGRALDRRVRFVRLPGPLLRGLLHAGRALGARLPAPDKANELLAPAWRASSEALRRATGWAAEVAAEDGVARTARAYRDAGWL